MILDILHKIIEEKPNVQVIKLSDEQLNDFYNYLVKYSLVAPPPLVQIAGKLQFLGRKIEKV